MVVSNREKIRASHITVGRGGLISHMADNGPMDYYV